MAKSKFVAVSEFLDGKCKRVSLGDDIGETDYSESTIKYYLDSGFIAERESKPEKKKAKKPAKNKQAKPTKNK